MLPYVFRYYVEGMTDPLFEQSTEAGETMISLIRRYGRRMRRIESTPSDRAKLEFGFDPQTGTEVLPRDRLHVCK